MFSTGNFIKLVSNIGSFNNTETLFEIYSVDENGFIEFGNSWLGKGMMDIDAAKKHFRLATDEEIETYHNDTNNAEYLDDEQSWDDGNHNSFGEKYIVEHITYGFDEEHSEYYGYFKSEEHAAAWVKTNYPDYEQIDSLEFQKEESTCGKTILIVGINDEDFQQNIVVRQMLGKDFFTEEKVMKVN